MTSFNLFVKNQMMFQTYNYFPEIVALSRENMLQNICTELCTIRQKYLTLQEENNRLRDRVEQFKKKQQSEIILLKKTRRSKEILDMKYKCPYTSCRKAYASQLAINLHIKTKHNGGTKTMREALAKDIMLAQEKGEQIPEVSISFPPGYLKEFKKRFFNQK